MSKILDQKLSNRLIDKSGLIRLDCSTIVKLRIITGNYQLLRVDYEEIKTLENWIEQKLITNLSYLGKNDILVISDYAKGLISYALAEKIQKLAQKKGFLLFIDPTPTTFSKFNSSFLVKPNKKEAEKIALDEIKKDYSNLKKIASRLKNKLKTDNLVITLGQDGMAVLSGKNFTIIPAFAREVFDVTGAGDTVMATLAVSIASGATIEEAAFLGNLAAGIVVSKIGTATCSKKELLQLVRETLKTDLSSNSIVDYNEKKSKS